MKRIRLLKALGGVLLLIVLPLITLAQNAITGKITHENGQSLPAVSIKEKSIGTGVTTDVNGAFRITVPPNETTLISFLGYQSKEVRINASTISINISLLPSATGLDEVVVIGHGTKRRETVTGSVSSICGEALRDVPAANIQQALKGYLPGVELTQTSRSLSANSNDGQDDPLVVLDGIPFFGSINDIDPNNIN